METIHMNKLSIIKTKIQLAILALACLALLSTNAHAHGNEIHVVGIVSKVSPAGISVKTRDGKTVEVGFGEQTSYMRLTRPVDKNDIKVGDRVVIHAVKIKDNLVAHTVELGAVV